MAAVKQYLSNICLGYFTQALSEYIMSLFLARIEAEPSCVDPWFFSRNLQPMQRLMTLGLSCPLVTTMHSFHIGARKVSVLVFFNLSTILTLYIEVAIQVRILRAISVAS